MPTKDVVIQGVKVQIEQPYAEGHTLSAVEANVLNQTRNENIRNNCAKLVKEWDGTEAALLSKVAEYDASYTFSTPSAGGTRRSMDPIEREARAIARSALAAQLKEQHGVTLKDLGKEKAEELVSELAMRDDVLKKAKQIVKAKADISSVSLEGLEVTAATE